MLNINRNERLIHILITSLNKNIKKRETEVSDFAAEVRGTAQGSTITSDHDILASAVPAPATITKGVREFLSIAPSGTC